MSRSHDSSSPQPRSSWLPPEDPPGPAAGLPPAPLGPTLHQRAAGKGNAWELGDLLGIHPHELNLADRTVSLNGQPVHVVAELAARLDMC